MKITTILGARPQFIKAAAVSRTLATRGIAESLVHTGQHYDANMSDVFFEEMGIPAPAHHLGIAGGPHGQMTGRQLEAVETVLTRDRPDAVLVYGDTNSTLAGALAAAKMHIPIAHVEAGLRSFNRAMPEEINRVLTDHCADWLLTPTDAATRNLMQEGIPSDRIAQVGDVMFDAALHFGKIVETRGDHLTAYGLQAGAYVLATVHRQENTDDPARLAAIVGGLAAVAGEMQVILPLHPRTRARLADTVPQDLMAPITIADPVGYLEMVALERQAAVIATDSGGVQKEAFFHRVPCVTLRDETEWVELVEAGWNRLVSPGQTGAADISAAVLGAVGTQGSAIAPYGTGDAAGRIADVLLAA